MDVARLILRGVSVQLIGQVLATAVSVFTLAATVRHLGTSGYGTIVAVLAFVGVFEAFVDFGVGTVVLRRVTAREGTMEDLVGLNLGLSLLYALPLAAVCTGVGVLVYAGDPTIQIGIAVLAIGLASRTVSTCYVPIYEAAIRFGVLTFSDLASRILVLTLTLALVERDAGVLSLVCVQVVPHVMRLTVLVVASRRHGRFRPTLRRGASLELLRSGIPFAVVSVVGILYFRSDGILLSLLSTRDELGAYGLAYRIAGMAAVLSTVFAAASFSTMTTAWAGGPARFRTVVTGSVTAMLVCTGPVLVLGVLLAEDFVVLVADERSTGVAVRSLQLLFAAMALGFLNQTLGQLLIAAHQQRYLVALSIAVLAFNIGVNLAVIPRWGAVGAGWALLASELVSLLCALLRVRRVAGVLVAPTQLLRLVTATGLTALVSLSLTDLPLLALLPALGLVYAVCLLATGVVRVADVQQLLPSATGPAVPPTSGDDPAHSPGQEDSRARADRTR